MTTRREVPLTGDTLAWLHNEISEIKARLANIQQTADQSRAVAADAADKTHDVRQKLEQFDGLGPVLVHLQDDIRSAREQLVRAQDDVHSLRQSREEIERRVVADAERNRQDRNEAVHRFNELERQIEGWQERVSGFEEHYRRNLEVASHLAQRIEVLEGQVTEAETLHSRTFSAINRIDGDLQRLAGMLPALAREDEALRERTNSAFEFMRRYEGEIEAVKTETNRISRLDDRLELVQAERTRHNERLNEIAAELTKIEARLNDHHERTAVIEVRVNSYQGEIRGFKERLQADRDAITSYLHSITELEADMRKRQIIALEKEIRDVRGRALNFAEE